MSLHLFLLVVVSSLAVIFSSTSAAASSSPPQPPSPPSSSLDEATGAYKRPWLRPPPPRFSGPASEGFFRRWTVEPQSSTAKRKKKRRKKVPPSLPLQSSGNEGEGGETDDDYAAEEASPSSSDAMTVEATASAEESCMAAVNTTEGHEEIISTDIASAAQHTKEGGADEISSVVDVSVSDGDAADDGISSTSSPLANADLVSDNSTTFLPTDIDSTGIASTATSKPPCYPVNNGVSPIPSAPTALSLLLRRLPPDRIIRMSLTAAQLGIAWYLCKAVWEALAESLEELSQMDSDVGGGSGTQEEHDRPFLSEEGVDAATGPSPQDTNADDGQGVGRRRRAATAASAATSSNLARRLLASGMPMDLTPPPPGGSLVGAPPTVRHVLKSLTRTEGRLLSNSLLSPIDDGGDVTANAVAGDVESAERKQQRIARMWNDIGGLEHVKEALLDLVFPMLMLKQRTSHIPDDALASAPATEGTEPSSSYFGGLLSNPPGVLLYGPPGCGKTTLVRALASTANARVLVVTPSTLLRKYVGETELQVRALFSLARKISPTIIFVDELDGIFRDRGQGGNGGGGEHEVNRDLKTEFMQLWDGVITQSDCGGTGSNTAPQVLVIGATNRPFDVDPGFLRRMPRSFYVGPPEFYGRCAVLRSMLSDVPLTSDFDLEAVARATEGYTPSDIKEVLRTAALYPLREARRRATEQVEDMRRAKERGEELPEGLREFGGIPPLRPLTTDDVLRAQAAVAPTHLGPGYRAALAEYATRAGCGAVAGGHSPAGYLQGHTLAYDGSQPRAYQHPHGYAVHKTGDGTFFADVGTATPLGMHPPEFFGLDRNDGDSFEEESESDDCFAYDSDVDSESETNGSSGSSSYDDDDI